MRGQQQQRVDIADSEVCLYCMRFLYETLFWKLNSYLAHSEASVLRQNHLVKFCFQEEDPMQISILFSIVLCIVRIDDSSENHFCPNQSNFQAGIFPNWISCQS